MNRIRYWVVGLCLILLLSTLGAVGVSAEDTVLEGVCGESATWQLNLTTGEMVIAGEGPTADYSPAQAPWFPNCNAITSVTVKEGITALGAYSFLYCSNLVEINLPESLQALGAYSFYNCTSLEGIDIPDGVTEIGVSAFFGCKSLQSLTLPEGVTSVGNNAFGKCTALTRISLPSTLTTLGDGVFEGTTPDLILFEGDAEAWDAVTKGADNQVLENALALHPGHVYDLEIVDPAYLIREASCTETDLYRLSCVCGETGEETFTTGVLAPHTGGEATCEEEAVCDVCGEAYGLLLPHTPDRAAATCTEDQTCTACGLLLASMTGHSYESFVEPPTCVLEGFTTHICSLCGDEYMDTPTEPTGHVEGPEATCTEHQTCLLCGDIMTPAYGHSYEDTVEHPTCTNEGYTYHLCSVCGDEYVDAQTGALGHTPGDPATCTEDQTCTVCGEIVEAQLGHGYTDTVIPPTCTLGGYTVHVCSACGDEYTDTPTDPTGHTEGDEATCTEDQTCTVCGEILTPRLGHDHVPALTVPPTCEDSGIRTYTCSRCEDAYEEAVDATGHAPNGEATCTRDSICTACGLVLTPMFGHDYTVTVVEPTCTEQGYTAHACNNCLSVYHDEFTDPTGHTEGSEATCTEDMICTVCGTVLTPRTGHAYADAVILPTCEEYGYTEHTCENCGDVYRDGFVDPTGHTEGAEATCTEAQTCTTCGLVLAPAFGHDYTVTVVAPACTEQGYTAHTCNHCLEVYHDAFTKPTGHTAGAEADCDEDQTCTACGTVLALHTGHTYEEALTLPTCDTYGYTEHTCSSCGDTYRDSFVDPTGHTEGAEATCSTAQTCTVCQSVLTPPLGHDNRDTVVQPTCSQQGYTQHTCVRCQITYRDSVTSATGHVPGAAPTCTEAQSCIACGEIMTQKLGHDYRATIVEGTCAAAGYISHECAICHASYRDSYTAAKGHVPGDPATCETPQICTVCLTVITPAAGHAYRETVTAPTCTEEGYTTHTCATCQVAYVDEITQPTGHTEGEPATCHAPQTCTVCATLLAERLTHEYVETVHPATCLDEGYTDRTCTLCGHVTLSDFLPATGHAIGDWVVVRDPDVGVSGRRQKTCEHCGEVMEAETFWATPETLPAEPDSNNGQATDSEAEAEKEGGCRLTGGNIAVIVIVLVAAFLLWFVDMRRR